MSLGIDSEIGRLRRVLVHRPGLEIDRMVPTMMAELLFDDILDGDAAPREHRVFRRVLRCAGVEVLTAGDLLAEVLGSEAARRAALEGLAAQGAPPAVRDRLADRQPADLAAALIEGLRSGDDAAGARRRSFALPPVPNYFFQRDPQVVLGDRVVISSMATGAREREPLLAALLFEHTRSSGAAGGRSGWRPSRARGGPTAAISPVRVSRGATFWWRRRRFCWWASASAPVASAWSSWRSGCAIRAAGSTTCSWSRCRRDAPTCTSTPSSP